MRQHFKKRDTEYLLSAAATFLVLSDAAYCPDEKEGKDIRPEVDEILARATRAGFSQSDIYVTLLSKGRRSKRLIDMSQEIVDRVGGDSEMLSLIRSLFAKGGNA